MLTLKSSIFIVIKSLKPSWKHLQHLYVSELKLFPCSTKPRTSQNDIGPKKDLILSTTNVTFVYFVLS